MFPNGRNLSANDTVGGKQAAQYNATGGNGINIQKNTMGPFNPTGRLQSMSWGPVSVPVDQFCGSPGSGYSETRNDQRMLTIPPGLAENGRGAYNTTPTNQWAPGHNAHGRGSQPQYQRIDKAQKCRNANKRRRMCEVGASAA